MGPFGPVDMGCFGRCREYTVGMDLSKSVVSVLTAPARIGLAVADTGIEIAGEALRMARRTAREVEAQTSPTSVAHMLGLDSAIERANRLARLLDDEAPLGRALAPTGWSTGCCARTAWWIG